MTEGELGIRARAEARLGTVLRGKYRLERVLGIGGMAVVYKATHRNQAEFAVKMLHPEVSLNADIRARFLREGYAANSIKHPGAVVVVDDDVSEDGAAFLVMELLDGMPCDAFWLERGQRLPVEVASAIVIQLLDVLAAAHGKGIIHRDIKPANLFLTRTGLVKVLDFGIARAREAMAEGAHATGTGMLLGTPAFMSPEHARGRTGELDGRADLWAAGATFFSLVSGQLVHTGAETAHELLIHAATVPARALCGVAPEVPAAVAAVIDRSLAFQKGDRWPTAEAMRDALAQAHQDCFGAVQPDAVVAAVLKAHGGARKSGPPTAPPRGIQPAQTTRTAPIALTPALRPAETLPRTMVEPSEAYGASARSAAGQATPSPMLRDRKQEPSARVRTPFLWLLSVGAVALVVVVGAGTWVTKSRRPIAGPASVVAASADAEERPGPDSVAARPAPTLVEPPAPADPSGSGSRMTPTVAHAPDASVPDGKIAKPLSRPPRHPSSAPDAQPAADCTTPFYFDAKGNKVFKKECL